MKDLRAETRKLKEMLAEAIRKATVTQQDAKANLASVSALREVEKNALGDVMVMEEDVARVASELRKQRATCKKVARHGQTTGKKARDKLCYKNG